MSSKLDSSAKAASARRARRRRSARERIFKTAAELFYQKGIRAVGVESIAADARTTKMSLYRNFPSKDRLVAEWLEEHGASVWRAWGAAASEHADDPRAQLEAIFSSLAKQAADPRARGCPMANAAVEITDRAHPARKVIEAHKARLRARLAELCAQMQVQEPALLADHLFLLIEGAQVSAQTPGARPAALNVARAASALIDTATYPRGEK